MQRQGLIFIFILIGQILLVMQINLKIRIGYNFFTNKGKIKLKIWRLQIINNEFSFEKGYLKIKKKNGKIKLIPLNIKDPETYKFVGLENLLFKKIYLKRTNIYINFGSKENAYATSMCCGSCLVLSNALGAYLHTKKQGSVIINKIYPVFNKDYLKVNLKISASISLFDFTWCIGEYQFSKKGGD